MPGHNHYTKANGITRAAMFGEGLSRFAGDSGFFAGLFMLLVLVFQNADEYSEESERNISIAIAFGVLLAAFTSTGAAVSHLWLNLSHQAGHEHPSHHEHHGHGQHAHNHQGHELTIGRRFLLWCDLLSHAASRAAVLTLLYEWVFANKVPRWGGLSVYGGSLLLFGFPTSIADMRACQHAVQGLEGHDADHGDGAHGHADTHEADVWTRLSAFGEGVEALLNNLAFYGGLATTISRLMDDPEPNIPGYPLSFSGLTAGGVITLVISAGAAKATFAINQAHQRLHHHAEQQPDAEEAGEGTALTGSHTSISLFTLRGLSQHDWLNLYCLMGNWLSKVADNAAPFTEIVELQWRGAPPEAKAGIYAAAFLYGLATTMAPVQTASDALSQVQYWDAS